MLLLPTLALIRPLADSTDSCRTCFFNTPLYMNETGTAEEDLPEYEDCPCCATYIYYSTTGITASNLDGPRCELLLVRRVPQSCSRYRLTLYTLSPGLSFVRLLVSFCRVASGVVCAAFPHDGDRFCFPFRPHV